MSLTPINVGPVYVCMYEGSEGGNMVRSCELCCVWKRRKRAAYSLAYLPVTPAASRIWVGRTASISAKRLSRFSKRVCAKTTCLPCSFRRVISLPPIHPFFPKMRYFCVQEFVSHGCVCGRTGEVRKGGS